MNTNVTLVLMVTVLTVVAHAAISNYYQVGGGVQPGGYNGGGSGGGGQAGSFCNSNFDCSSNLACTPSVNGVKICLSAGGEGGSGLPGSCTSSANCPQGSTCTLENGVARCEVQIGGIGISGRGQLNDPCSSDADCEQRLSCTRFFGSLICRPTIGQIGPGLRYCSTESDCPSPDYLCVFSTALHDRICYKYGETVTEGYVIPIRHRILVGGVMTTTSEPDLPTPGPEPYMPYKESSAVFLPHHDDHGDVEVASSQSAPIAVVEKEDKVNISYVRAERTEPVERPNLIDPAAQMCEFDYQCRMGESCSAVMHFVDRNITVCQYDVTKKRRQCIFHSDCLSGQRCTPASGPGVDVSTMTSLPSRISRRTSSQVTPPPPSVVATCEPSVTATIGSVSCVYDYECSGGEKCTLVDAEAKEFRCRPPAVPDPRRNQLCTTNAQCPFQQVCRRRTGVAMCVDVSGTEDPALLQEKVVQFVRDFLFRAI